MSTPLAKLKIPLTFSLNNYNTIKDFLEAVREIFPEQTIAYCGNSWEIVVKEGYVTKTYSSGTDFLNAITEQSSFHWIPSLCIISL